MTSTASITAKLLLDATGYNKELDKSKKKTKETAESGEKGLAKFSKAFESLTGVSLGAAGAITVAFMAVQAGIKWLNEAEKAAVESAKADAKLEAVLNSTGYAAGMTTASLSSLTNELSRSAGIDDELITSAEAVLLTFTKLGRDVFPETMQAAIDMSAVLGQDLQSSVTMIGKAMNDFSGYTALKRAGVSFTEEQIKQIEHFKETNDLIGYQNLLLKELQTEYGGAAKAINKAGDGLENLKVAEENYKEAVGKGLIPIKKNWNEFWTLFFEDATKAQEATNAQREATKKYNQTLEDLGYTMGLNVQNQRAWVKDGVALTKEQADALVEAAKAQEKFIETNNELTGAIGDNINSFGGLDYIIEKVGETAEYTDEQLAAFSAARTAQYQAVSQLAQGLQSSEEDLLAAEEDLYNYAKEHPLDTAGIAARQQKVEDLKEAQDLMVKQWMLNVYTQMLTADGDLSEADMEFLLQYQVNAGLITQANADKAMSYYLMAQEIIKNNVLLQKSIDGLHGSTIYINAVYTKTGAVGSEVLTAISDAENAARRGTSGSGISKGFATGGQTVANSLVRVNEGGPPEVLSIGQKDYLMTGNDPGMVKQYYGEKSETPAPVYSGPTAREMGKEVGTAVVTSLQKLGLV